ncbi:MAG: hypothetical protein ABSG41_28840 [Bryobacteraceae bacterium]
MPDHQRSAAEVIPIDRSIPVPVAPPRIVRSSGVGALDTDQLAAVLARILEL